MLFVTYPVCEALPGYGERDSGRRAASRRGGPGRSSRKKAQRTSSPTFYKILGTQSRDQVFYLQILDVGVGSSSSSIPTTLIGLPSRYLPTLWPLNGYLQVRVGKAAMLISCLRRDLLKAGYGNDYIINTYHSYFIAQYHTTYSRKYKPSSLLISIFV